VPGALAAHAPLFPRLLVLPALAALALAVAACGDGREADAIPTQLRPTSQAPSGSGTIAQGSPTPPASINSPPTATCGSGGAGIGAIQRTGQRRFDSPPARVIDPAKGYVARMETSKGPITLLLAAQDVPNTTNNFVFLACNGYYDGLTFHRVVLSPPFVIQGGDPEGTGNGGPGYRIRDEINLKWRHDTGALAMARTAQPNSAGSQFYITLAPQPGLDGGYTVFGRVLTGMEVVREIRQGDTIVRVDVEEH
jgi:peptidyl-prolyl cis-trans isomerase B (cyclophilin B)